MSETRIRVRYLPTGDYGYAVNTLDGVRYTVQWDAGYESIFLWELAQNEEEGWDGFHVSVVKEVNGL